MGCSASTATAVMMDPALDGEGSLVKSALQSFSPRLRNVVFVAGGASPSQQAVTQFLVKRLAFTEASFPAIAAMASESGPAKASAFAAGPDSAEDAQAAEAATARKQVAAFLTYLSGLSPGSKVVATGFPSTLAQWKAWQTASPSAASTLLVFSVNGELDAHADSAAPPASSASSAAAAAALAPAPAAGTASSGELAAALLASGLLRRIPTGLPELQALQIAHRAAASLVDPLVKPAPGPGVGGEATDAAQPDGPAPSLQRMGSQQLISAAANAAGIPVTRVLFAVAGPGAGKRQHAQRIAAAGGYTYISAGDLLKAEVARGGAHAAAIADALAKGALVDGDVVCALIERELTARAAAGTVRFLVEGFPRSQANRDAWERLSAGRAITEGVLYLDCPEQVLRARVGQRSEAKDAASGETPAVVAAKFDAFVQDLLPMVAALEKDSSLARVDASCGDDVVLTLSKKALSGLGIPLRTKAVETTFAMIKPDAVAAGHTEAILARIAAAGFFTVAQASFTFSKDQAEQFYEEHRGKAFFDGLVSFMTSGPVVALALRKVSAIGDWRRLAGPTNSARARVSSPSSLRAVFGRDGRQNAVHGSDSPLSANRELKLVFPTIAPEVLNTAPRGYHILLAGGPASGKGTQAELLRERLGVVHISTGELLREERRRGTALGNKAAEFFEVGKLVPDDIMIPLVMERISREDCRTKGWMLDGFPRTGGQADALVKAGLTADVFVLIDVPDAVLVERVAGRRTSRTTGKIYHMKFNPPPPGTPASDLEQRADDTEEKVRGRISSYKANIDSIREAFKNVLTVIPGDRDKRQVFEAVLERIPSNL